MGGSGPTTTRRIFQQTDVSGGTVSTGQALSIDINRLKSNTFLGGANAFVSGIHGNTQVPFGCVTNHPPVGNLVNNTSPTYTNGNPVIYNAIPHEAALATLDTSVAPGSVNESVVFTGTGTGSQVNTIGINNKSIQMAMTASQTSTATDTISPTNLSTLNSSSLWSQPSVLAVDSQWTGNGNFSSGTIKVGLNSSNYYQWSLASPGSDGNFVLKFNWNSPTTVVGSPTQTMNIGYVQLNLTASAGGSLTVIFSNVRLSSFGSTTISNNTYAANASNIYNVFPYIYDKVNNLRVLVMNTGTSLYVQSANNVFGINDNNISFSPLASGFTNVLPLTFSAAPGQSTSFQFMQFPNLSNQSQDTLYFVNGSDGYFSYNANAATGSKITQISATKFKFITSWKSYAWLAGDPNNPNTLFPSLIAQPGTLDSTSNLVIPDDGNGQAFITGILPFDDYLVVFRNIDIWLIYGTTTNNGGTTTTDLTPRRSKSMWGASQLSSICRAGSSVFFFNGTSALEFNGVESTVISEPIDNRINSSGLAVFSSISYNPIRNQINLNIFSGGQDPFLFYPLSFTYDLILKCWSQKVQGTISSDTTSSSMNGFYFNIYGGQYIYYYYNTNIWAQDSGSVAISSSNTLSFAFQTSWNSLKEPFIIKDPDKVRLYLTSNLATATTGQITISSQTGNGGTVNTFSQAISISNAAGWLDIPVGPSMEGTSFSISVILTPTINTIIVFSGYAITYTDAEVV